MNLTPQIPCGSGLSREDRVSVSLIIGCETAFASKPAPTLIAFVSGEHHG